MKFETATFVEQLVWEMRLADWPRAQNRVLINELFSGVPPYTADEQITNNQETNYNDLSATKIDHDARTQFDNAFIAPDPLFSVNLDYGPSYKRVEWSGRITKHINRIIIENERYLNLRQGVFASVVLHGVGPTIWDHRQNWLPTELGIEDVLIPSNTLSDFANLPFFAVYRQYTANQFYKMTHGPRVDPGWNMGLVDQVLNWVDTSASQLIGQNWPEVWSPEKMFSRRQQDTAQYASDAVPTVDVFDFYFWNDEDGVQGWNRRMVLDAWGDPGAGGVGGLWAVKGAQRALPKSRRFDHGRGEFLFNSGKRKYANKLSEIMHFQFGDITPVAPFRYHSVRSLGFMLHAICSIQNRLKCRFTDSVFENMMQYFRVANPADMDRLQQINLRDKGMIPDGAVFVKPEERWRFDQALVEMAMGMNRQAMADLSASFTQDLEVGNPDKPDETATLTMAKVNSASALIGGMLNKAYAKEKFRQIEICRRFCMKNSKDPDVKKCRMLCLRDGIPDEALNVDAWEINPVRVIGQGNKLLQVAIADKLQVIRPNLDPDAQAEVDRIYIAANTNDWNLANKLKPHQKMVSSSQHDAELASARLLMGLPVALREGINHTEYIEELLVTMALVIKQVEASGGMATMQQVIGLQTLGQHIEQHILIIAQDKRNKSLVKKYQDALGKLMNTVKAYGQRLAEQQQQSNGQGKMDPKDASKIQANLITAQAKAANTRESHAQRTAQRQLQFEQTMRQDAQKASLELKKQAASAAIDLQKQRRMTMFEGSDE